MCEKAHFTVVKKTLLFFCEDKVDEISKKRDGKYKEKNVSLSLNEDELLSEKVRYDKSSKSYKEKDVIKNAWTKTAEELDYIEDGTSIMNSFTVYVPCGN